jgi:predicted ATPase
MQFSIRHIGLIASADVKLDGLTVIAGENDTGKSTVGKLLFAIIKGVARHEQDLRESKVERLEDMLESLVWELLHEGEKAVFVPQLQPFVLRKEFRPFIDLDLSAKQTTTLFGTEDYLRDYSNALHNLVKDKIELVRKAELGPKEEVVVTKLEEIEQLLSPVQEDRNEIIKRALKRAFNSEFYSELSPRHQPKSRSTIVLTNAEGRVFDLEINDDRIGQFDLEAPLFYEDVTFVDSPVLLQMFEVIKSADTLLELESDDKQSRLRSAGRPKVALHQKDLMNKIEGAGYLAGRAALGEMPINETTKTISELTGGSIIFDRSLRDFVFQKKHNGGSKHVQVRAANTASGIKSFGMIQLLVQAGFLDRRSLLIVDEPETHLHPQWQIEYARLLVALVQAGIPVLLTSHSPYLVQALRKFSEKEGLTDRTNFYLAERMPKAAGVVMQDVTNDLNRLFQKLSEPLQKLVWE